ncbi:MAG: TlpA family protein disulfide reductase [Acidimicrobiales bacterium]
MTRDVTRLALDDGGGPPPSGVDPPDVAEGPAGGDLDETAQLEAEVPRQRRTALVVSAVIALLVVGFVAVLATRDPATDRQAESDLIGEMAPTLAGETLDGGSFDIEDHRGRWVVVNFFATWCNPCIREHPQLVAFDETHRVVDDAVLVSVLFENDPDEAAAFFADNGGEWPVVLDGDGLIATRYGVPQVPETYLVAPNGRVALKLIGGVTQGGLEDAIRELEGSS